VIWSSKGSAAVSQLGDRIEYRPLDGDPLGLHTAVALGSRDWLGRTFDGPFPDAPVQLLDQFRSPRTGDLIVVAREGFDFRDRWEIPEHKSGHGSMIQGHMQTPLVANRPLPDVPLRTADLFPTMLHWLGAPIPASIDGARVWAPRGASGLWPTGTRA
jgi:hypothetical protein